MTIYPFFANLWAVLLPSASATVWYGITRSACHMVLITGAYLLILLALGTRAIRPLRERINANTLTYLYAVGASVGYIGVTDGFPITDWYVTMLADRVIYPELSQLYWPDFWAPSTDAINQIITSGVSVPWGIWLPNILWWGTLLAIFAVCTTSVSNIFRRAWIDVEKVPFPQTVVAQNLVVRGIS